MALRWHGSVAVLPVSGEIDLATAAAFESELFSALHEQPAALVVDLSSVAFLGSLGLAALARAAEHAGRPGAVRVVAPSRATALPLQTTGLTETLPMFTTCADALATPHQ